MVCAENGENALLTQTSDGQNSFDARGRFAPGNKIGANRSSGKKRKLLTEALFVAVTPEALTEMVQNMINIALDKKSTNSAVRAFSVICDTLGLKQSTVAITSDLDGQSPEDRACALRARMAELLLENQAGVVPATIVHE